jgi:hydrogenase expression/formation protein HypE
MFMRAFANPLLGQEHDGAVFAVERGRLACSTDSFVVSPVFFAGGNIGDLAVNGTLNDLACCGAIPLYLTLSLILEEGLLLSELQTVIDSIATAVKRAEVQIITGDTKVVERGKCDRLFINTAGIGRLIDGVDIAPHRAAAGDVVICSAPIGVHGTAIMLARGAFELQAALPSDTAALHRMVIELLTAVPDVHVLRDPTRGGLSSALNEIARTAGVQITLDEAALPIPDTVRVAADLLGLDPLYIANEGVMLVILPEQYATKALHILRTFPEGRHAVIIGRAGQGPPSVRLKNIYGVHRIVNMLNGNQLPRIC